MLEASLASHSPDHERGDSFIWSYDGQARLIGENLYEDKTSLEIEVVDPDEAITPARVREIHREQLATLEAERGDRF